MERCSFPNCKAKALHYCLCSLSKILICAEHVQAHMNDESKCHALKNIYGKPNAGAKDEILEYIKNEKGRAEEFEKNLPGNRSKKSSSEVKIMNHILFLDNLKEKIQKTERISEFEEDADIKLLRLAPKTALKKFKKRIPKLIDKEFIAEMLRINNMKIAEDNDRNFGEIKYMLSEIKSEIQNKFIHINEVLEERINNFAPIPEQIVRASPEQSFMSFQEKDEALSKRNNIIKDLEYDEINKLEILKSKVDNANDEVKNFPYCTCCEYETLQGRLENLVPRIEKIKKKFQKIKIASENKTMYKNSFDVNNSFQNLEKLYTDLQLNFNQILENINNSIVNCKYLFITDQDFINRKSRLTKLDTSANKIKQNYIENIGIPLSSLTCTIPYSDNELICINGFVCFGNSNSGYSCIIDTKTSQETQALSPFTPSKWVGGIKYKHDIFLFGGTAGPTDAWKYNNIEKSWRRLSSLPEGAERCSCDIWKDSILICGTGHNSIWKYIIAEDRYEKIDVGNENMLNSDAKKILFVSKQTIYLMEWSGRLFISDRNDETKWHMVRRDTLENFYRAYKSFHNGKVYIGLVLYDDIEKHDAFYYYCFNDEEQKLEKMNELTVPDDFNKSFQGYGKEALGKWQKIYNSIKSRDLGASRIDVLKCGKKA